MENKKSICEFYRGKHIFITGGSGFVGKAVIEKLLRSCPDIGNIYTLLRPKKGKGLQERLEQIISNPLFDVIRKTDSEIFKKIIPIEGDAMAPGLGISDENRRILVEEVNIFFHVAASVKFDDFLRDAIFINIRSTRDSARLALEMKKIEVFLHVSTTYCTIENGKNIHEVLYPANGNWREAIEVAESCDSEVFNTLSLKYMSNFPNSYTYTKLLAEHCVNDLLVGKIPTVICRPSVVISSIAEPFQGWIDNINGPVGLLLAGGSGLLRTVYGDPDIDTDYIAVDNVVKIIIVSIWYKAVFGHKEDLSIYHASKHDQVQFKQEQILSLGKRLYWDVPFEKKIWFPGNALTKCWYNFFLNVILFHMIPAFFLDILLRIAKYPPILFKIQRKIYIGNMAVSHFMLNQWNFVNSNALKLLEFVPSQEITKFNFKIVPVDDASLYSYYLISCEHSRKYLLKEKGEVSIKTRERTKRMYYLDKAVKYTFFLWITWMMYKKNILGIVFNMLSTYWNSL